MTKSEEKNLLNRLKQLEQRNKELKATVEYLQAIEEWARKVNKLMSYLRNSHNESISRQANKHFGDYFKIIESHNKKPIR